MTAKRFRKLLMGCGLPRDVVESLRMVSCELGISYDTGFRQIKEVTREILLEQDTVNNALKGE